MAELYRGHYGPVPQDDANLLSRIEHKDDFHASRLRCLFHPDRALDTLAPHAVLELQIIRGRDLLPRPAGLLDMGEPTTDSLVQVLLDDCALEYARSEVVRSSTEPQWESECTVDIVSPMSMVRLQVTDENSSGIRDIGFVEFCVGDLPYEEDIEGWLELRFQDNLQRTSVYRYASHSRLRDDDFHKLAAKVQGTGGESRDVEEAFSDDDLSRRLHVEQGGGALQACLACTRQRARRFSTDPAKLQSGMGEPEDRANAGEIYVSMRLKKVVGEFDSIFALALAAPVPKDFGHYIQVENLPHIDLQFLYDQIWEFKVKLIDDAFFCVLYYIRYVAQWRNPLFSLALTLSLIACAWHLYLTWIVLPGIAGVALAVNSIGSLRSDMTRGGFNAPLTQDGFRRVAKWMDSDEMYKFVTRLVEDDIHGSIVDSQKLRVIASRCFRDGIPSVTLDELRHMLRGHECIYVDQGRDSLLKKGDLVLVDERDRATVVAQGNSDNLVVLAFEAKDPHRKKKGSAVSDRIEAVERRRIRQRVVLPSVAQWLLPRVVDNWIRTVFPFIQDTKRRMVPLVEVLTQIVTWQWPLAAFSVTMALLSLAFWGAFADAVELTDVFSDGITRAARVIMYVLRNLDNIFIGTVMFFLLVHRSRWFVGFRSLMRIIWRLCRHRRMAPACWAFFREDEEAKAARAEANLGSEPAA